MEKKERTIKTAVIESYSSLAKGAELATCCDSTRTDKLLRYGYSAEELASLPESVVAMSDGCGNPTGLGMIREGNVVLDLGSGGGIDVLLASRKVGFTEVYVKQLRPSMSGPSSVVFSAFISAVKPLK